MAGSSRGDNISSGFSTGGCSVELTDALTAPNELKPLLNPLFKPELIPLHMERILVTLKREKNPTEQNNVYVRWLIALKRGYGRSTVPHLLSRGWFDELARVTSLSRTTAASHDRDGRGDGNWRLGTDRATVFRSGTAGLV
jgi:hypothetical protein